MEIPSGVVETIRRALEEDVGPGDRTTSLLIPEKKKSSAQFIAKENLILAGLPFASLVFQLLDQTVRFRPFFADGDRIKKGRIIAEVSGYTERTAQRGESKPEPFAETFGHRNADRHIR